MLLPLDILQDLEALQMLLQSATSPTLPTPCLQARDRLEELWMLDEPPALDGGSEDNSY
jgi:hypothetical protein